MKKAIAIQLLTILAALPVAAQSFPETWAYLMKGEEQYFPATSPITDVACFSASVDGDGNLSGGHMTPPPLPGRNLRYHLVVTIPWNPTLAHIYLNPELPFRNRIINGIVERSKPFDGVQIDFEGIKAEDGTNYLNFLSAVKKALPADKLFSVAVMARWAEHKQQNPADAFDYPFISMIADRVMVMAYDEHHRSGPSGPIASLPWCRKIYDYSLESIDANKLIMGIPLYGRSWQSETMAKAFRNQEVWTELRKSGAQVQSTPENGGSFTYTTNVAMEVHFETLPSLDAKMKLYGSKPIRGIAFWRISQEPLNFWQHIAK